MIRPFNAESPCLVGSSRFVTKKRIPLQQKIIVTHDNEHTNSDFSFLILKYLSEILVVI